jgi:hypothetical protein
MRHLLLLLILTFAAAGLHGCTTTLDDTNIARPYVKERWLDFLREGAEKQEVMGALGKPTSSYYDGNLLAYRLVLMADKGVGEKPCRNYNMADPLVADPLLVNLRRKQIPEKGDLVVVREGMKDGWRVLCSEAEYHLLIVFGNDAKIEKYSFLEIFPK